MRPTRFFFAALVALAETASVQPDGDAPDAVGHLGIGQRPPGRAVDEGGLARQILRPLQDEQKPVG